MTPPPLESRPNDPTQAKLKFLAAAHAASPLRAVEKYPWTAVSATAAATLGVTVIAGGSSAGKAGSGLVATGLGLVTALMRSPLAAPIWQNLQTALAGQAPAAAEATANTSAG